MILRIFGVIYILAVLPCLIRGSPDTESDVIPVVIDSDGGADDAFGLLLFLWNEANNNSVGNFAASGRSLYGRNVTYKLVAVTSVAGNTGVQNATRNLETTLEIAGRLDIPVYSGAHVGLMGIRQTDGYYGYDGFGDFLPPVLSGAIENRAVDKLVELSEEYEGSLVIICLGPLTNIALAQRKDPRFLHRIKKINMMGGTVMGYGNIKPGVEFNIYQDPESVDVTFRETPNVITVMPYDPILLNKISKNWRENILGKLNSTRIKFLNMVERKSLPKLPFWSSADPQAVATALWPQLITKSLFTRAVVETGGVYARGAVLVDHKAERTGVTRNVIMIQEINLSYYQQLLLLAFKD